jgi:hypothetical protein
MRRCRNRRRAAAPAGWGRSGMLVNVALQDGFDQDSVVMRVDGAEAYRGVQVTTRTQISHAADTQLEVPAGPFTLEVEVPTRGVHQSFQLDPQAQPNVALSLRDGTLVAAYPERLGFA